MHLSFVYVVEPKPTLHHHLVTGHQDLLAVAGLRILQDGGARLCCRRIGHGESLQALHAVGAVVGQLDSAALRDGNWERKEEMQPFYQQQRAARPEAGSQASRDGHSLYWPLLVW